MGAKEDVISKSECFYKLIRDFLYIERNLEKKNGRFPLIKPIKFDVLVKAYKGLEEKAIEANNCFILPLDIYPDNDLVALNNKLSECFAIYVSMLKAQVIIVEHLDMKSRAKYYSGVSYVKEINHFDKQRKMMEIELPVFEGLYEKVLSVK